MIQTLRRSQSQTVKNQTQTHQIMNRVNLVNKIKIIHWNCFKLNQNKYKEIENFLNENSPD
jgi:hypothetical protein